MNKYKKILNIVILSLILLNIGVVLINLIIPAEYDINTNGKGLKNYDDVSAIYSALTNYINVYKNNDFESFNSMIPEEKRKSDNEYKKISEFVNQMSKEDTLYITKIERLKNTTYVIEYVLSSPQKGGNDITQKCVIKLNKSKSQFYVYYDSLWEKG